MVRLNTGRVPVTTMPRPWRVQRENQTEAFVLCDLTSIITQSPRYTVVVAVVVFSSIFIKKK